MIIIAHVGTTQWQKCLSKQKQICETHNIITYNDNNNISTNRFCRHEWCAPLEHVVDYVCGCNILLLLLYLISDRYILVLI